MSTLPQSLGLTSDDTVNRVATGTGRIGQRTIEIGGAVISVDNIGSMFVIDGKRSHFLTIVGAFIMLMGLGSLGTSYVVAAALLFTGGGLAYWNAAVRPVEQYLSIGTCDGRRTTIVSKKPEFLNAVRAFIRDKIDTGSAASATINISNSTLEGVIAVGDGARASK
jgi:hypothetical protein